MISFHFGFELEICSENVAFDSHRNIEWEKQKKIHDWFEEWYVKFVKYDTNKWKSTALNCNFRRKIFFSPNWWINNNFFDLKSDYVWWFGRMFFFVFWKIDLSINRMCVISMCMMMVQEMLIARSRMLLEK